MELKKKMLDCGAIKGKQEMHVIKPRKGDKCQENKLNAHKGYCSYLDTLEKFVYIYKHLCIGTLCYFFINHVT